MLYLLLTYDYELFFNKSFASEEEVLIKPSYSIAKALSEEGVPATFFVDTPSVLTYRKFGFEDYPRLVKDQIQFFLKNNHDVQLHVHPIWYHSKYESGEWVFDNDYYGLKSFSNINEIIRESKSCLDEMAEGNNNYHCCAFRAGGFCYNPVKVITESLIDQGIKIDSSVCKGWKMNTFAQEFDYTHTPRTYNWFFDSDNMFKDSDKRTDCIFEIPVGTYGVIPNKWILSHCMPKLVYPPKKGLGTPIVQKNRASIIERIKGPFIPLLFTLDSLHAQALEVIVKYYENKSRNKDIYISVIGHPKFSSDSCLDNTVSFVRLVKRNCHNTRFVTMKEVASFEKL